MPDRILSGSAAAALAALLLFASEGAAQAARCPLGEIYRPSRGVCVSKEKAIQAGVYHAPSRARAVASRSGEQADAGSVDRPDSYQTASADPAPAPKPRPQALVAIERRAPAVRKPADDALAFTANARLRAEDGVFEGKSLIQAKPVQATTISYTTPAPSPFGSLVALEPMP